MTDSEEEPVTGPGEDEPLVEGSNDPDPDPDPPAEAPDHAAVEAEVQRTLAQAAQLGLGTTPKWAPSPLYVPVGGPPQSSSDPRLALPLGEPELRLLLARDSDPVVRSAAAAAAPLRSMQWRARLPRVEDVDPAVHDGDTLWLETDQGDWYRKVRSCRLLDTWAPETSPPEPGGAETREYARAWIATWNVGRWPFWVDTYQTGTGRDVLTWDRFVVQVWNASRTRSLNADVAAFVAAGGYGGGKGS